MSMPVTKLPYDKAAKFRELAEKRVSSLLKRIGHIANLANRSSYEYDEQQIGKMFRTIRSELDAAEKRFNSSGKAGAKQFHF